MRNCLILGSGRSGTSMVAGTLSTAGYFMGENLYPARDANPKGFFEDPEINGINEALLAQVTPRRPPLLRRWIRFSRPRQGQRWLARVPVGTVIPASRADYERIGRLTAREPYCFKDPRFCYTLPVWEPFLRNTVFVCIFRDPASTAVSILKECRTEKYLRDLRISMGQALEVWTLMYRHVLERHRSKGEWLFVHYDQMLDGEALTRLAVLTGARIDRSFPDHSLSRSVSTEPVPETTRRVYDELCSLANYHRAVRVA